MMISGMRGNTGFWDMSNYRFLLCTHMQSSSPIKSTGPEPTGLDLCKHYSMFITGEMNGN